MSPTPTSQDEFVELRNRSSDQEIKQVRLEIAIDMLTKQGEKFDKALEGFTQAVQDIQLAMSKLIERNTYTNRIISVIGAILIAAAGVILGQFIHLHP